MQTKIRRRRSWRLVRVYPICLYNRNVKKHSNNKKLSRNFAIGNRSVLRVVVEGSSRRKWVVHPSKFLRCKSNNLFPLINLSWLYTLSGTTTVTIKDLPPFTLKALLKTTSNFLVEQFFTFKRLFQILKKQLSICKLCNSQQNGRDILPH